MAVEKQTAAAKKVEVVKHEAVKDTATAKKTPAKKTASKKTTQKKELVTTVTLQHGGRDVLEKDLIETAKKDWIAAGHKKNDLKELALYIKPEENTVYYVVNGTDTGSFGY